MFKSKSDKTPLNVRVDNKYCKGHKYSGCRATKTIQEVEQLNDVDIGTIPRGFRTIPHSQKQ